METKQEKVYPRVYTSQHKLFTFVELAEKKVIICVGQQRVSEREFKTLQQAKAYVDMKPWELICNVSCLVAQQTFNQLKKNENEKAN